MDLGLWRERHPAMPLWRRGARGLEFWSLHELCLACAAWADGSPASGRILEGLESDLASVWFQADQALKAQAARLAGQRPAAGQAEVEARWFPQPRRTGGDLARALGSLEWALLGLWRLRPPSPRRFD